MQAAMGITHEASPRTHRPDGRTRHEMRVGGQGAGWAHSCRSRIRSASCCGSGSYPRPQRYRLATDCGQIEAPRSRIRSAPTSSQASWSKRSRSASRTACSAKRNAPSKRALDLRVPSAAPSNAASFGGKACMFEHMDVRVRLLRSCVSLALEHAGPKLASSAGVSRDLLLCPQAKQPGERPHTDVRAGGRSTDGCSPYVERSCTARKWGRLLLFTFSYGGRPARRPSGRLRRSAALLRGSCRNKRK